MEASEYMLAIISMIIVIINLFVFDVLRLKKHRKVDSKELDQDVEQYEELHTAICNGSIKLVRQLLQDDDSGQIFSQNRTSALYQAFSCEQYEIAAYLIHKGAKFHDYEVYDLYKMEIDLTRMNYLLFEYNKKLENSCIFRLISWSQSPQGFSQSQLNAVKSMLESFFKSDILKLLMKVLENEEFDMVYDFNSDKVNRIHRLYKEEGIIFGLTLTNSREIFVGAKNLISDNSQQVAKVYGVVAEELCHLAMTTIFKNNARPYKEGESHLIKEFREIVKDLYQSLSKKSCRIESVIKDVFTYPHIHWESELIARVPHVVGIYGEGIGRRKFQESPELSKLLSFYEQNVIPKCKVHLKPSRNTRPHQMMKRLINKNNFISFKEKQTQPLKEGFPSFRESLMDVDGISVMTTNCLKVCTLQVYHELKKEYGVELEAKCLFFASQCFDKKREEILEILKSLVWEYFVLVVDEEELNLERLTYQYLDDFDEFKTKSMKVIIISESYILCQEFQQKTVNYKWQDLSEEYKDIRTQPVEYFFKGERHSFSLEKGKVPKDFSEKDIIRIMSGEVVEVKDGKELVSKGYISGTYIEREFRTTIVDRNVFKHLPQETGIFLSGLNMEEFEKLSMDKKVVQWLDGLGEDINDEKSVFIMNDEVSRNFQNFVKKSKKKWKIWMHYAGKEFILRNSNSSNDFFNKYLKQITFSEKELLKSMRNKRIIIISDNAGYGKSTVLSSLINDLKHEKYDSLLYRIDFKKFSTKEGEPLSLANINKNTDEENILNHLFLMIGISDLEKNFFMEFSMKSRNNVFLFFDGFDEIPLKYKTNALMLLSTVKDKTIAKMIITTRKHHQRELENLLNTYSYELVPFSRQAQAMYLGKLWKSKLKYPNGGGLHPSQKDEKDVPEKIKSIILELNKEETKLDLEHQDLKIALENIEQHLHIHSDSHFLENILDFLRSEIEKLDFTKLADNILCKSSMNGESLEFMGIPLHLYMLGIIHYDRNFNVEIHSDIYSLYSDFIKQKILIYMEEKQEILHDGRERNEMVKLRIEDAYRIHIKLADQLMDEGNAHLDPEKDKEDLELCVDLGMVFKHGEEIDFLHFTFAEFFKAESLRQQIKKEPFNRILFDEKYNVVRRFLTGALEKQNFEKLTKEFFEEISFLESIVETIPSACALGMSEFDYFCVCKIVKKLLENFEKTVEEDSVSKFIGKLEKIIKRLIGNERCFDYFNCIYRILGLLPVSLLKNLVTRNSMVKSVIILSFVRYSENAHDVIDVLRECISIRPVGKWESDNGDVRVGCLLELLSLKDLDGKGLLYHALWNGKGEIFKSILMFLREVLGKEQFIKVVVHSAEYRKQMERFIESALLKRICDAIKGLHCIFKNESGSNDERDEANEWEGEVHPNSNRIHRLSEELYSVLRNEMESDEWRDQMKGFVGEDSLINSFHSSFNVLHSVFGHEKENLISKDSKYLVIDTAVLLNGLDELSSSFEKVTNLIIKSFGRQELADFLLSRDYDGNYLIHVVCKYLNSTFIRYLNLVKEVLGDDGTLKKIIKSKVGYFKKMFHLAALNNDISLDDLLQFCEFYFERDEIKEILLSMNDDGYNVIHSLTRNNSTEMLMKKWILIKGSLGDVKWFQQLLESKSNCFRTILHFAAMRNINLGEMLYFCDTILKKEDLRNLLLITSEDGSNVMHYLARSNSSKILLQNLLIIKEISDDDDWFKMFLEVKDQCSMNMFQIISKRDMNLEELLKLCDSYIDKKMIKEMLLGKDKDGYNILHNLFKNNSFETLWRNLLTIRKAIGDDTWFKEFCKSKDECLRIIFEFASKNHICLENLLLLSDTLLEKDEIQDMLLCTDEEDFDVMHYLFGNNASETLMKNLMLVKETLRSDERLKLFLKRNGKCYINIFHFAAERDIYLHDLLQFCCAHLEIDEIKQLLSSFDQDGHDVLQALLRRNSCNTLINNLKVIEETLGENNWLKELLKNKTDYFRKLINSAAQSGMYFDDLLHFCVANFESEKVKEMILSNAPDQHNVVHHLFMNDSPKTVIKNLKLIKEIFGDDKWFKDLLKANFGYFRKIIDSSARGDSYLSDILPFYGDNFETGEIKEMLINSNEYGMNVMQTLFQSHSPKTIMKNLQMIRKAVGDDEWLKQVLKCGGISFKNMLHVSSAEDTFLDDLLQFCDAILEKDETRKILMSNRRHGNRVIDQLVINKSSDSIMRNLKLIQQILADDDFLKQFLKSKGQSLKNIFQLASVEGIHLNDLLQFCDEYLDKNDMKQMLLETDADGDNVIHCLVLKNSPEILLENLKIIEDILGDQEWFKQLLKSKGQSSKNIFHLATIEEMHLHDLLQFSATNLTKDELKEMLISEFKTGNNVIHLLVLKNSSEMLMKNLKVIKNIVDDKDWLKQFLKSKGQYNSNILHLASNEDNYLNELLRFCDEHLEKNEIKDMLVATNDTGDKVIHLLVLRNSSETLIKNLKFMKDIVGDGNWFRKLLKSKGQSSKNIIHLASIENILLEDIFQFLDDHLEKDDIKELLLSTSRYGDNVIHLLVLSNSPVFLIKNLMVVKEIVNDEEWFKNILQSKGQSSKNIFHLATIKGMCLNDLLQFCSTYLKKVEIKEMLCSTLENGCNVIHLSVMKSSSEILMKNLKMIKKVIGDNDWLKNLLKSKGLSSTNIFHLASTEDVYLNDLMKFCSAVLKKCEIKEMIISPIASGDNVIHLCVLKNSPEILIKNLTLINEVIGDDEWIKDLLKSKGQSSKNIFHLASVEDVYLNDLMKFCAANLEKNEIKELITSPIANGNNVIHLCILKNSPEILIKNLKLIKEVVCDGEWLKKLLKSKGQCFMNILQLAAIEGNNLKDLLQFCVSHLEKEEIKDMLVATDEDGDKVIHLLVLKNSHDMLIKNLNIIREIVGDDEWLRKLLQSKGQSSGNIFHLASRDDIKLENLLKFCGSYLEKDAIKEILFSSHRGDDNLIHLLVINNSSEMIMKILNLIKEIVCDDVWFKELLTSRGQSSKNIFQLASIRGMYLEDLLRFCYAHLEKEDFKEMLLSTREYGYNVIHLLVVKSSSVDLWKNLETLKEILNDEELFSELLTSKAQSSRNIFHLSPLEDTCFGTLLRFCNAHLEKDTIKKMLFSTNKHGDNLIHILVLKKSHELLMKNLKLIQEIVDDAEWFKNFLKSKGQSDRNIFQLASIEDIYLENLLQFCDAHLPKEEIKEMLFATNGEGDTVIHLLVLKNHSETLMKNLKVINEVVGDGKWFKEVLKSKGQSSKNIFQLALLDDLRLDNLLRFCNTYLEKQEIQEMLLSPDSFGDNLLHVLVIRKSSESLMKNLKIIKDIVGDDECFKDLLKSKGQSSKNIIQLASIEGMHLQDLLRFCNAFLEKDFIKEMLLSTSQYGDNVIHLLVLKSSPETLIKDFRIIKEVICDDDWFKKILMSKGQSSKNILHLASIEDIQLKDLLYFCDEQLEKFNIKEMLISKIENGNNVIHLCVLKNSPETLIKNLKLIKEVVGDDEWFNSLLKSKGQSFQNIFQLASMEDANLNSLLRFCDRNLNKGDIKEMIMSTDELEDNVIHHLVLRNSSENLINNLKAIKEIVRDEMWFKQLLKCKGQSSKNIFHLASAENIDLKYLVSFCDGILEKEELKDMFFSAFVNGSKVVHLLFLINAPGTLVTNLNLIRETVRDLEWFNLLLKSKGESFRNVFHFAALNKNRLNPLIFNSSFPEGEIAKLLMERDKDGRTCLHHAALHMKNISVFLDLIEKVVRVDEGNFEEVILAVDKWGDTFLHLLGLGLDTSDVKTSEIKIFDEMGEKLPHTLYKKLLKTRNKKGLTFLQIKHGCSLKITKCCKRNLERDLFEDLLKPECGKGNEFGV